ncbi:CRISPR-associated endonuclease Cas2 [Thermoplasma sp. Kam2015]|uniref:CRISPR-associated endonuclease Cas2 n=1 Tax=Thermoplasma sp. Kam2015 TaxID=2094122 RepID=UPI000D972683|nr:CRISPR-associated endonuclease Cas2 [Thermoplasma sp. Kam2015]PYB67571.1 CRISPR-associated endonuclease Cas2 [Thermoplasma sp. Kam2015]
MYAILVYDVDEKRVSKINKYLKRYLIWVQNSVFEGEITDALLNEMMEGLDERLEEGDSVILYKFKTKGYVDRFIIGEKRDLNVI